MERGLSKVTTEPEMYQDKWEKKIEGQQVTLKGRACSRGFINTTMTLLRSEGMNPKIKHNATSILCLIILIQVVIRTCKVPELMDLYRGEQGKGRCEIKGMCRENSRWDDDTWRDVMLGHCGYHAPSGIVGSQSKNPCR